MVRSSLDLIYQDDFLLVINKPAGIHSTTNPESSDRSIAALLAEAFPENISVGRNPLDAGLINRLDFSTSGLLLAAKTAECWNTLFDALKRGKIEKRYYAILEGEVPLQTSVSNFIGSSYRRSKKVRAYKTPPGPPARALPARSEIRLLAFHKDLDLSLVEFSVHCARRHQIRAHAAGLNHPLLGDSLYGSKRSLKEVCGSDPHAPWEEQQFFLQAYYAAFNHPVTRELLCFSLSLPARLGFMVKLLQNEATAQ